MFKFISEWFGGTAAVSKASVGSGPVRAQSVVVPSSSSLDRPRFDEPVMDRDDPILRTVSPSKAEFMDEFNGLIQAMHSMHEIVDQSYDFMTEEDKRNFVRTVRSVAVDLGLTRSEEDQMGA